MKKIMNNIIGKSLLVASMLLGFSACAEKEAILPEFPQTQKLYFSPTENTKEITVSANYAWKLVSSTLWCQFEDEAGAISSVLTGLAGETKAKLVITDNELKPGDLSDVAIIEMQMEDEIRVFAEVYRSEKGYEFSLVDPEGKAIADKDWVIEAGYGEFVPFQVKANFDFAVTSKPAWVEFSGENSFTGKANEVSKSAACFDSALYSEKYPIAKSEGNVIVFSDKEGKVFFSVPVQFAGMSADEIKLEGPTARNDWEVSIDGKVFKQSGSGLTQGESSVIFKNQLDFDVAALNDEFKTVYMEIVEDPMNGQMVNCSLDPEMPMEPWMHLEGEKGKVSLTVDPGTSTRKGYVLVFTNAQLDSLGLNENPANWYEQFVETSIDPETMMGTQELAYAISQSNLLAELNQKEDKPAPVQKEIKVTDFMNQELPYTKVTDPGMISDYGTDQIFSVIQTVQSINIEHFLTGEMGVDWTFQAWNMAGDDVTSMIETMSETMINIWFDENLAAGDRIDIVFRNPMTYQNLKVVVIESNQ